MPSFADWYEDALAVLPASEAVEEGPRVTLSAQDVPLLTFARQVADQAALSIVVEAELDDRLVSLEVRDLPAERVLALVARRLGVDVTGGGRVWYIGKLRREDRAVLVRRVSRLTAEDLSKAVQALTSDQGRVQAFPDGLLVVADRVDVLERVRALLSDLEAAPAECWVVQLHLVGVRESELASFGLQSVPTFNAAAAFAEGSEVAAGTTWSAAAGLSAVLVAARSEEGVSIVAAPLFLVRDGSDARMADGDELRLPRKTVSDQGTVTTTGFDVIQTGLEVDVGVRDLGQGRAQLVLRTSLSAVVAVGEEGQPTVNRQSFHTEAVVQSGGCYLLGALERSQVTSAIRGPLRTLQESGTESRSVLVWARLARVGGPAS